MILGVIDWGIGGMGLVSALPSTAAIRYFSDAGQPPYGTLPPDVLAARLSWVCGFLVEQGAERIVLACNAASSVLEAVSASVPVEGVIAAGLALAAASQGTIGVIGGQQTIASEVYGRPLRAQGREVRQQSAQPLSALVEQGRIVGPAVEDAVREILDALGDVDALLLGCTHYPALIPIFQRQRPGCVLLDPIDALVADLREKVTIGERMVWTSGDPVQTKRGAAVVWGIELSQINTL